MPLTSGPFAYNQPNDPIATIPAVSEANAKRLNGPRESNGTRSDSSYAVPSNVSEFTLLPGLVTVDRWLTAANGPWLYCVSLSGWVEASNMAAFHRFRLRVTNGDGTLWRSNRIPDQAVFKGGSFPLHLQNHVVVTPGATAVAARVEYLTPASTTLTLFYPLVELTPIRPVSL